MLEAIRVKIEHDKIHGDHFREGLSQNARNFGLLTIDPDKRFGHPEIRDHAFMEKIKWDQIKALKIPPPIIPSRINVDYAKMFENVDLEVSTNLKGERQIKGFDFKAKHKEEAKHKEDLRFRTVAVQYSLKETASSTNDQKWEREIDEYLANQEPPVIGYVTVRENTIYCRINGCEKNLKAQMNHRVIYESHYTHHPEVQEKADAMEPPAKKAKMN